MHSRAQQAVGPPGERGKLFRGRRPVCRLVEDPLAQDQHLVGAEDQLPRPRDAPRLLLGQAFGELRAIDADSA